MASGVKSIVGSVGLKEVSLSFENGWATSITNTTLGIPARADVFAFVSRSSEWVIWRKNATGDQYVALAMHTSSGAVGANFTGTIEGQVFYRYY
jgi:ribosomal protein L35AE/L33A